MYLKKRSVQQWPLLVTGRNPLRVLEIVQNSSLDGEQVFVCNLWAVEPHELREAHQIFNVVARRAPADGDLGGDLPVRGRAEVDGVVCRSDVDQSQQGVLALLSGKELHRFHDVAARDDLPRVQVLQGAFDLGMCHLIGHAPRASLRG